MKNVVRLDLVHRESFKEANMRKTNRFGGIRALRELGGRRKGTRSIHPVVGINSIFYQICLKIKWKINTIIYYINRAYGFINTLKSL